MQSKPVLTPAGEWSSSRSQATPQEILIQGIWVIRILKKFPGDADAAGPGTTL